MIAFSGHGSIYDNDQFFFPSSDYDPKIESSHMYWKTMETYLENLGCPTLLILDTCHSGQVGLQIAFGGARGTVEGDKLAEAITEFSGQRPGLFVLAAAHSDQLRTKMPGANTGR